jgi:hypothetical protein
LVWRAVPLPTRRSGRVGCRMLLAPKNSSALRLRTIRTSLGGSDVETRFVCYCGKQGADLRPISTGTEGAKLRCAIVSALVNAGRSDSASEPRKFRILSFFQFLSRLCIWADLRKEPGSPTQVVNPSVSRAALLQGTALTLFVERPSAATMSKPVPVSSAGNGPVEYGVGDVLGGAYAPV